MIRSIKDITVGSLYLFPKKASFSSPFAGSYQSYYSNHDPALLRVSSVLAEDKNFTRINFFFQNCNLEGEYNIMICQNDFYDQLHPQFRRSESHDTMYAERNLVEILLIPSENTQEKIKSYITMKDEHQKLMDELANNYKTEINKALYDIGEFISYEKSINSYTD